MIGSLSRDDRERHAGGMPPSDHEAVAAEPKSFTGQYLKPLLARSTPSPLEGEGRGEGRSETVRPERRRGARKKASSSEDQPDLIAAK
jgi:hypothetical protein